MPPVGFEPKISVGERPQAAHLLRSWVRIPPGAWIFVCCECRVLSGRGPCDELITRPEESYRLCCVVVCDLETSRMGAPYIYDISRLRVNPTHLRNYERALVNPVMKTEVSENALKNSAIQTQSHYKTGSFPVVIYRQVLHICDVA